ncbi:MAG: hypothetical protein CSA72_04910 [Rhodobacterales bacterium]|nr:MAG: hypothetical protein CSA72_04910 [Rhodobacterales bacterium]
MIPYAVMLAAGVGIPVLAALNAALGRHIGSPAAAATVLFIVAFCVALATALVTAPQGFSRMGTAPRHLFLAGTLVAFYVLSITWIAPMIGIGNAVFLVLLGQLVSAALIDHFGLFGALPAPISPSRALGIAIMALGVFVTIKV